VIPNGFDLRTFAHDPAARERLRSELGMSDTAIVVGQFARLHPMKDHAGLLRAANLAVSRDSEIHFLMTGAGVSAEAIGLATYVERRFHANIHIFDDRPDIPDLMQAIDLYASSSSRGEGFPNVIGEAMASSRPCVGTDVGDTAAIIGDSGITVPPCDPQALADSIVELARDPARRHRLGTLSKQKIQSQFDIDRVAGQYIDRYAAALPNWRG
jgi:glycosyltransferase involved in cell wall biosynthesis